MRGYTIFISCNLRGITTMPPRGSYWSRCSTRGKAKKQTWRSNVWPTFLSHSRGMKLPEPLFSSSMGTWKTNWVRFNSKINWNIQSSATTLKPLADNRMKVTDQGCSTMFQWKTLVLGIHVNVLRHIKTHHWLRKPPGMWFDLKYRFIFWSTVS